MGPIVRYIIKVTIAFLLTPLKLFRVKQNRIFLLNDLNGKDANFSSNPKYIAEYILEHHKGEYEIVYALGKEAYKKRSELPIDIKYVQLFTLKYYFNVMTSKVFITTSGGISYIPFRKNQTVINSWHGGGAYKKMGMDTTDDETLRKALHISEAKTTYFLSSNKKFSEAVNSSLLIPKNKMINSGLPRNDLMFEKDDQKLNSITEKVKKYYNVAFNKNIVLYAPTYRAKEESIYAKHTLGPYDIDFEMVVNELADKLGGEWVFAIRLHPSISNIDIELPENVINMSDYDDPQELFVASDVLINDYSSTMWDFSLTRKPCLIYATDLANYNFKMGFYTTPNEWPFPLAENNEALQELIRNFNYDSYLNDLDHYYEWMENYDLGQANKILMNLIKGEKAK